MTPPPTLRVPSLRATYGTLVAIGAAVLVIGLLLPYLVADPVADDVAARAPLPSVLDASDSADPSLVMGEGDPATATTAGSSGGASGTIPGAAGAGDTGGSAARTASDIGITADAITVGIPVPDVSAFGDVEGGVSFGGKLGDPEKQWRAFIDDLNERGGIGGRRVNAVYRVFDIVDPDSMRAACIYLTEEAHVFAVLGGFYGDPILCITEQHRTLLIAQASEADEFYLRSKGMYFSIATNKDRSLRNLVARMHADGVLNGRTIGVLDQEGIDAIPVERTLMPELERLGYKVTYYANIAADAGAAQAQIPIEVQRMRAAGVDLVLPASGLILANVFAQEADSQRYHPQYVVSDFAGGATDLYTAAMPDSFEGSIGYTALRTGEFTAGLPEPAHDAACRAVYEGRTGQALDRRASEYYLTLTWCGIVRLFERATATAGANPTRASVSQALQAIGRFDVAFGSTGSFGPGKFDAPDTIRRVSWRADCRCWLPIDQFQPTPT